MGSCISLHKTLTSSAKPQQWFGTESVNEIPILTPPTNDQDDVIHQQYSTLLFMSEGNATTLQDQSYKDDDMFFDSQVCLESDCEDFFSVDGDFIPSRGHSPIHQSSIKEVQLDCIVAVDKSPDITIQSSPKDAQKKLSEFLHENLLKVEQVNENLQVTTLTEILKPESDRLTRSVSCCLISFPRSLSFGERKKGNGETKAASSFLKIREASIFKKPFHCTWY